VLLVLDLIKNPADSRVPIKGIKIVKKRKYKIVANIPIST